MEISADQGSSWTAAEIQYADGPEPPPPTMTTQTTPDKQKKPEGKEQTRQPSEVEEKEQQQQHEHDDAEAAKNAYDTSLRSMLARRPKCWSWCFWRASLPAWQLLGPLSSSPQKHKEIVVRAFDEAFNSQGPDLRWNVLGMMNNAWYRVRVETRMPMGSSADGPTYLRFQHPVLAGGADGGWMKPSPAALNHTSRLGSLPRAGPLLGLAAHRAHKLISAEEVSQHQSRDDCWLVLDSIVYDVSPYMADHPGGAEALLAATKLPPTELSALFNSIHASDAFDITGRFAIGVIAPKEFIEALDAYAGAHMQQPPQQRQRFYLGSLHPDADDVEMASSIKLSLSSSKEGLEQLHRRPNWQERPDMQLVHPRSGVPLFPAAGHPRTFLLHSTRWCAIKLLQVREVSHDTKIFTFGSDKGSGCFDAIGLTTGQHLLLAALVGKEHVVRPYTPIWPVSMEDEIEAASEEENSEAQAGASAEDASSAPASPSAAAAAGQTPRSARFDLLIKIYRRHGVMPGGKLTSFLDKLTPESDAVLRVKGPTGYVSSSTTRPCGGIRVDRSLIDTRLTCVCACAPFRLCLGSVSR